VPLERYWNDFRCCMNVAQLTYSEGRLEPALPKANRPFEMLINHRFHTTVATLLVLALLALIQPHAASGDAAPINPNLPPYNASGSSRTITCTAAANSNLLQCPAGTGDFAPGQGIRIGGAGSASPLTSLPSVALRVNGPVGSVRYDYAVCTADPWRGIAGCARETVNNGPPVLSLANSITVTSAPGGQPNGALFLVYRRVGAGSWHLVVVNSALVFDDIGWTPNGPDGWPSSPPLGPVKQDWWSTVRAIGNSSITLADSVPGSVSNALIMHDDTLALQAAINAGGATGRLVKLGPYTYPVNLDSVYSYASQRFSYRFTKSTYRDFPQGLLQLPSGAKLQGSGRHATVLATDFMGSPSGPSATFCFNTGHHNNPFFIRDLPTSRVNAAPAGARIVKTLLAADAGRFARGDYIMVYGGATLPAPYVSSEFTRVVGTDRRTGDITIANPLEKPLPLGVPGTPPTIAKLNGEIVHDISIRDLTINNYSAAFCNTSAVMYVSMSNLDVPLHSNGDFWAGGFRRFWAMDRLNIVSQGEEFDDDEDVSFRNGSWLVYGNGLTVDEGSSTVIWSDSRITYNERFCARPMCGPNNPAGNIGAHMSVKNWQVTNDVIRFNQALSNAVEGNWTLVQQGGTLKGYTPSGTLLQRNTINTNARYGLAFAGPMIGPDISNNQLYMTPAAGSPLRAVHMYSGNLTNNTIQISAPSTRPNNSPLVAVLPSISSPQPIRVEGNRIRVIGPPNYVHIGVIDPGASLSSQIIISNNTCENSIRCVDAAAAAAHLRSLRVTGNVTGGTTVPH
jgi:hypothetical protein